MKCCVVCMCTSHSIWERSPIILINLVFSNELLHCLLVLLTGQFLLVRDDSNAVIQTFIFTHRNIFNTVQLSGGAGLGLILEEAKYYYIIKLLHFILPQLRSKISIGKENNYILRVLSPCTSWSDSPCCTPSSDI